MAILVYTSLRVLVFAAVWILIELVTPIHGVWAAAAAVLISGAISVVLLDRPRNKVGAAAGTFFGRINERIDASARAEDDDSLDSIDSTHSGNGEQAAQHEPVYEQQDPGLLEGGDQGRAQRPAEHDAQG
jgi:hypothetical protein